MTEEIEEFLKEEKISSKINMTVWSKELNKRVHINPIDFINKYNKFLRKNSFLK